MVKGGKRYHSMENDGKWFAHPVSPENETRSRETCTSTGIMLTQVKSSLPQAYNFRRYSKHRAQQESRDFPFSLHDNKHALKDISVFSHGVGRRRSFDIPSQHNSHFCLCNDEANSSSRETSGNLSVYKADFTVKQPADNVPGSARRFPRNHRQKSAEAALAQTEQFMWFGRDDYKRAHSATYSTASSRPKDTLWPGSLMGVKGSAELSERPSSQIKG